MKHVSVWNYFLKQINQWKVLTFRRQCLTNRKQMRLQKANPWSTTPIHSVNFDTLRTRVIHQKKLFSLNISQHQQAVLWYPRKPAQNCRKLLRTFRLQCFIRQTSPWQIDLHAKHLGVYFQLSTFNFCECSSSNGVTPLLTVITRRKSNKYTSAEDVC